MSDPFGAVDFLLDSELAKILNSPRTTKIVKKNIDISLSLVLNPRP